MAQLFGNFITLDGVTPRDAKLFGFAAIIHNDERDEWHWTYEVGSFDYIFGHYRASQYSFEHDLIGCMAMFTLAADSRAPTGIISSLYLTPEESQSMFCSTEPNAKVVLRDLIVSNNAIDYTDLEGQCDFEE